MTLFHTNLFALVSCLSFAVGAALLAFGRSKPMDYIPYKHSDGEWYALLVNGESLGPYPDLEEMERDLASIQRHLEKSFGGAK